MTEIEHSVMLLNLAPCNLIWQSAWLILSVIAVGGPDIYIMWTLYGGGLMTTETQHDISPWGGGY